jgi:hypothetical protein
MEVIAVPKFEAKGKDLYINGHKVIKAYESYSGWYWFAVEEVQTQDTVLSDGSVAMGDTIYYGLVQGYVEEWGDFSKSELESLKPKVWEISKRHLPYSGRW